MKAVRTEIPIRSWLTMRAGIVIHPSMPALRREYIRLELQDPGSDETLFGFCHYHSVMRGDNIATLHFCRPKLTVATISHEAFHAGLVLGRHLRIDLENNYGEELLAEFVEKLANETVKLAKRHKIPVGLIDLED